MDTQRCEATSTSGQDADPFGSPEGRVHLWVEDHRVRWDELETYSNLLDAGERARASRFRFRKDYRRFIFGHARLRSILARYLGGRPDALEIARRCAICGSKEHGKPFLLLPSGEPSSIRFSYSYSDQLVVIAVSNETEIGVDVERVVPGFAWRDLAETALSPRERSLLDALHGDAATRAFYGIWTRKEAVSKASGQGLDQLTQMDSCDWTYRADGRFEVSESSPQPSWVGRALEVPGHEAAVALEGASTFEWSIEDAPWN